MTCEEFIKKLELLCPQYGFLRYISDKSVIYPWEWDYNKTIFIYENKLPGKPNSLIYIKKNSSVGEFEFKIGYNSVVALYSPTGQYNFISKSYEKNYHGEKSLDKFDWNILEKWLECQSQILGQADKFYKERILNNKLKQVQDDF